LTGADVDDLAPLTSEPIAEPFLPCSAHHSRQSIWLAIWQAIRRTVWLRGIKAM
jgi:hypothetical protein